MRPRAEHSLIPEHWPERTKDVRRLVNEFHDSLNENEYSLPTETEGVVVLSAPPDLSGNKTVEKTPENISRIQYAIDFIKQIAAEKSNKPIESLEQQDLIKFGPPLILNGETEQLPAMQEIADDFQFPSEHIQLVNCGDRGMGNTKTQFEAQNSDPRYANSSHLTYITTSYHVPRVARTADANLDKKKEFEVIGVPLDEFKYDIYKKIKGEVKRILQYSERGDLTKFFKDPATPLTEFNEIITEINQKYIDEETPLSPEAEKLRSELENNISADDDSSSPTPFNGPLLNVEDISYDKGSLSLKTSKTDYFSYLASSYNHRNNQQENPIRPLAVSASLLTPEGDILFENRSGVNEMEGKLHVFGGSLKPGENPNEAIQQILHKKLGIEIGSSSIEVSGVVQENLQNIVKIFYVIRLQPDQIEALEAREEDTILKVSTKQDLHEIESLFHKQDITDWNPSGFFNVMYALSHTGSRTPDEVKKIVDQLQKKIKRKPYRFTYPIEQYLTKNQVEKI